MIPVVQWDRLTIRVLKSFDREGFRHTLAMNLGEFLCTCDPLCSYLFNIKAEFTRLYQYWGRNPQHVVRMNGVTLPIYTRFKRTERGGDTAVFDPVLAWGLLGGASYPLFKPISSLNLSSFYLPRLLLCYLWLCFYPIMILDNCECMCVWNTNKTFKNMGKVW